MMARSSCEPSRAFASSLAFAALAACATPPAAAPVSTAGVEPALRTFLAHFERLEWEPFLAAFAPDACVFHPSAKAPLAVCRTPGDPASETEFEARWRHVFDDTRAHGTGPRFMVLEPQELRVTALGRDAALATFVLRNADRLARRSVVFVRAADGGWRISHIHASNVPWPDLP